MNKTTMITIFLFSFVCCMAIVAWLLYMEVNGWGWVLFAVLLFYGSVKIELDTNDTPHKNTPQKNTPHESLDN